MQTCCVCSVPILPTWPMLPWSSCSLNTIDYRWEWTAQLILIKVQERSQIVLLHHVPYQRDYISAKAVEICFRIHDLPTIHCVCCLLYVVPVIQLVGPKCTTTLIRLSSYSFNAHPGFCISIPMHNNPFWVITANAVHITPSKIASGA